MLKISFYNRKQKYIAEFEPFCNGEVRHKVQEARGYATVHPEISGWTVFESSCGEWYPYHPFNGNFLYCCIH